MIESQRLARIIGHNPQQFSRIVERLDHSHRGIADKYPPGGVDGHAFGPVQVSHRHAEMPDLPRPAIVGADQLQPRTDGLGHHHMLLRSHADHERPSELPQRNAPFAQRRPLAGGVVENQDPLVVAVGDVGSSSIGSNDDAGWVGWFVRGRRRGR